MYKLVFFVPETSAEPVKAAVFSAGGGRYRDYDSCAWQTMGTGQFRPLEGSTPFIGQEGRIERVPELRVEILCTADTIVGAVQALLAAHPYEEVAYEICEVFQLDELSARESAEH